MKKAILNPVNYIFLCLAIFYLWPLEGVHSQNQDVLGKYTFCRYRGFRAELELKSDGTYFYKSQIGLGRSISYGNWKKNGNSILLNSAIKQIDSLEIIVSESLDPTSDSVNIYVENSLGESLSPVNVIFNNDTTLACNAHGCYFKRESPDLFFLNVYYFNGTSKKYEIKCDSSNYFKITLPNVPINLYEFQVFDNARWSIGNTYLEFQGQKYIIQ